MIDWIAAVFVVVGVLLLAKRRIVGWIIAIIGNILWVVYGVSTNQDPLVSLNVVLGIANLYGLYWWAKPYLK